MPFRKRRKKPEESQTLVQTLEQSFHQESPNFASKRLDQEPFQQTSKLRFAFPKFEAFNTNLDEIKTERKTAIYF